MNPIKNYLERQLCEYNSIFPTVTRIMEHLLFVIGNGYRYRNGKIYGDHGSIDSFPKMTPARWDKLISECIDQSKKNFEAMNMRYCGAREYHEEQLKSYYPRTVADDVLTEDAFYRDISAKGNPSDDKDLFENRHFVRPYPLSNYSIVTQLDSNAPTWLLEAALNFCKAWVRFLDEQIAAGEYWTVELHREQTQKSEAVLNDLPDDVLETLRDLLSAAGADREPKEEPTTNRADLQRTTHDRDQIQAQVVRLTALLQ